MPPQVPVSAAERATILTQAQNDWEELRAAIDAFSDDEIDRENAIGTWSVRDVMVHIANWEEELLRIVTALDADETPVRTITDDDDIDVWNEREVARFHSVPLADARAYYYDTHRTLMERAATSVHLQPTLVLVTVRRTP